MSLPRDTVPAVPGAHATIRHPLQLSDNARTVLAKRYLDRDDNGQPRERPEELFERVARAVAEVDRRYDPAADVEARTTEYYNLMADLEFLPNSPTLMNAGRALGQLSACFVLPVPDSLDGIFTAVAHAALIHQSGGGTGFAFSRLRPARDTVRSTHGISSGPVSFMRVFDTATETIKQGGTRRGANMGILRVDHPDITAFIRCKRDAEAFTNFNISVGVTDAFMAAWDRDETYALVNPRTGQDTGRLRAREVFDAIVAEAWRCGDPGLVFLDRINADNPTPHVGTFESTNPCGEQPLLPYESCNLGSVNLGGMTVSRDGVTEIDYPRLGRVVRSAVGFLDNVIDANRYPLPEIEAATFATRKIGLGVMGFADLLIRMGIPYDSQQALDTATAVMAFIQRKANAVSLERGAERGVFAAWEGSVCAQHGLRYRNATRTTVAPTGTISIIAGASSGIEPLFGVAFVRRQVLDGTPLADVHPLFVATAQARGFYSDDLMARIAERGGLDDVDGIPDDVRRCYRTAHQVAPEWHVNMQAAFQRHTDNAVSKTVNLSHDATEADVRAVYLQAHRMGCKGVTIYRDRSRATQVLTIEPPARGPEPGEPATTGPAAPRERPPVLAGETHRVETARGHVYVTVNTTTDGQPFEVFAVAGTREAGGAAEAEGIGRLVSLALRAGVPPEDVIAELEDVAGEHGPASTGTGVRTSLPQAVAAVLRTYTDTGLRDRRATGSASGNVQCPLCGSALRFAEGCVLCPACGFSQCG